MDRRFALLACAALALAGCEPTVVQVPAVAQAQATVTPTLVPPVIANLDVPSKRVIGAELFEVHYDVTSNGSGIFSSYGLSIGQARKTYKITIPIPVIDNGHVDMPTIGPLPDVKTGGEQDVEFWVVDSAGQESNHLAFKMTVQ